MGIKKMKKICFCIEDITRCGGTESVCVTLANALVKKGYDVHILSLLHRNEQPFFSLNEKIHSKKIFTSFGKRFFSRSSYVRLKIWLYCLIHQIDIIVDTDIDRCNQTIPAIRKLKIKHVAWEHFSYSYFSENPHHQAALPKILSRSNAMVVLTQADRNLYMQKQGVPDYLIHQIYNPIIYKEDAPISHDSLKVISLGRFSQEKGFDLLLRAWQKVERETENWTLEIWGDTGDDTGNVHATFNSLNLKRASLHPSTRDVGSLLKGASIYVLPSRSEGLGLVLMEASSYSLPLIAFDCPNGPREIIRNGVNGVLVEAENIDEMAKALLRLMKDKELRTEMGKTAFYEAKRFSEENIVNQWEDLFNSILAG